MMRSSPFSSLNTKCNSRFSRHRPIPCSFRIRVQGTPLASPFVWKWNRTSCSGSELDPGHEVVSGLSCVLSSASNSITPITSKPPLHWPYQTFPPLRPPMKFCYERRKNADDRCISNHAESWLSPVIASPYRICDVSVSYYRRQTGNCKNLGRPEVNSSRPEVVQSSADRKSYNFQPTEIPDFFLVGRRQNLWLRIFRVESEAPRIIPRSLEVQDSAFPKTEPHTCNEMYRWYLRSWAEPSQHLHTHTQTYTKILSETSCRESVQNPRGKFRNPGLKCFYHETGVKLRAELDMRAVRG